MQVERVVPQGTTSGKRVRNTLVTCLRLGYNLEKSGLIPDDHEPTMWDYVKVQIGRRGAYGLSASW